MSPTERLFIVPRLNCFQLCRCMVKIDLDFGLHAGIVSNDI